jgi:TPR repeat protein
MKKHLLEAAAPGDAEAQFNLAMMCENGAADSRYTSEGNHSKAMRWLLAAATRGLPRAQIKLAEFYADESEAPESSVKACGWYLMATANLDGIRLREAQTAHKRLSDHLTAAQNAEARRFDDWKAADPAIAVGSERPKSGSGAGA